MGLSGFSSHRIASEVIRVGYRIVYTWDDHKITRVGKQGNRIRIMTACFFLCFLMLAKMIWSEGTAALREHLLPPGNSIAQEAFSRMLTDLREGERVEDAVTGFCRFVIENSEGEG